MADTSLYFLTSRCLQQNSPDHIRCETQRRIEVHTLKWIAALVRERHSGGQSTENTTCAQYPARTGSRHRNRQACSVVRTPKRRRTAQPRGPISYRDLTRCRHEFLIMSVVHRMAGRGLTCTQRELYYQLVRHVPDQSAINAYLQRLVHLLQLPREALGVVAGARGLVSGTLSYRGTPLDAAGRLGGAGEGISIPVTDAELTAVACESPTTAVNAPEDIFLASSSASGFTSDVAAFVIHPRTRAIVVVEKHAVYHQLCLHGFVRLFPCVLVTSQGFPCLSARKLVHALHTAAPHIPVVGLVDFNPSGVAILLQYKFGLGQMEESSACAVPALRWLGLRSPLLCTESASSHGVSTSSDTHARGVFTFNTSVPHQVFTARDVTLSAHLCDTLKARQDTPAGITEGIAPFVTPRWISEVEQMQSWRVKVELEALYGHVRLSPLLDAVPPSRNDVDRGVHGCTSPRQFVEWLCQALMRHHYI